MQMDDSKNSFQLVANCNASPIQSLEDPAAKSGDVVMQSYFRRAIAGYW